MDQTAITAAVRIGIKEPNARRVSDTAIVAVTLRAARLLGLKIKEKDPSYYNERKSISSYSNVFSFPTGCKKVNKVWDYAGTVISITGAADNGSGLIRITAASHGFDDEAIITIHDILGCTEANGTWQLEEVDDDNFDLLGSTFVNAWTAGGKIFQEKTGMIEINKTNLSEQTGSSPNQWYLRTRQIVVDDVSFTNDIVIDYEGSAAAITDIPDEYHEFLPSWVIVNLIEIPKPDASDYAEKLRVKNLHESIIQLVLDDVSRSFKSSSEPTFIRNVWGD